MTFFHKKQIASYDIKLNITVDASYVNQHYFMFKMFIVEWHVHLSQQSQLVKHLTWN